MLRQKLYLKAESILKYLTSNSEKLDTLIMCKSSEIDLTTTDQSLYEAIGSIDDKNKIDYNRLVKLLEVVEITPFRQLMKKERTILKEERVSELRELIKTDRPEEKTGKVLDKNQKQNKTLNTATEVDKNG